MNRKLLALLPILLCVLFMLPAQKSEAAAGVTGDLTFGVSSVLLDSPVAIKCYDMETAGGYTYAIEVNSVEKFQWANHAGETERVMYYTFTDADVASNIITIELLAASGGATLQTYYLAPTTVDTFFPDELIFALFIPILIAVILVAIVLAIRSRRQR